MSSTHLVTAPISHQLDRKENILKLNIIVDPPDTNAETQTPHIPSTSTKPSASTDSKPWPESASEVERGRKRFRQQSLSPHVGGAPEQVASSRSRSRNSLRKFARSLSRAPSAHTGVHFLTVAGQEHGTSPSVQAQSWSRHSCHYSHEDQKHYFMMRWLEASHR